MKNFILFVVLIFSLNSCKVYHQAETAYKRYDITANEPTESDEKIVKMIAPYKKQLDDKMNEVIGIAEKELVKTQPEGTLGNWAADAIFAECNTLYKKPIDFAVVNNGGIRIPSISKGDISTGKIFELMPFDNMLVVLHADGNVVKQLFETIAINGGWPVSSGVKCVFTEGGILKDVSINGKAIEPDRVYQIGMSDYIANGGDNCSFFKEQQQYATNILFRDAFLNQVKIQTALGKNIDSEIEGRMIVE